jgi:hypothetical protein
MLQVSTLKHISKRDMSDLDTTEPYYNDFFAAIPSSSKPSQKKGKPASPQKLIGSKKAAGVRFNDQVRVREIERKGKGRSLSSFTFPGDDEDDDDEDDDEDEDDGEGASMDGLDMDVDMDINMDEDDEESGEDEEEEGDEDDAQETIDRFRDDLFADEEGGDEEEESKLPPFPLTIDSYTLLSLFRFNCSRETHARPHCSNCRPGSRERRQEGLGINRRSLFSFSSPKFPIGTRPRVRPWHQIRGTSYH